MKKFYLNGIGWQRFSRVCFPMLAFFCLAQIGFAQTTVTIGTGTSSLTSSNAGPIYRSTATSGFDFTSHYYLYTETELAAQGIFPGAVISSVAWNKTNAFGTTVGNTTDIWQVYMKSTSTAPSSTWSSSSFATQSAGATLVYNNTSQVIPAAAGWVTLTLTTPFTYTGGSLEIGSAWDCSLYTAAAGPSTGAYSWMYTALTNQVFGTSNSTSTLTMALQTNRPNIQLTFTGGTPPSCFAASGLMTPAITSSSVTLSWTAPTSGTPTNYEYAVTTSAAAPASGTLLGGTGTTKMVTGLSPNTTYYAYVRTVCAMGPSSWISSGAFNTPCNASTIPFFEGFESGYTQAGVVAGCWQQASITGAAVWSANNTLTTYNRTPRTGAWNAYLQYSNEDWLFIPVQLTGGTSYTAKAYARQDGTTTANSTVGISYGTAGTAAAMTNTIVAPVGINDAYQLISGAFTPPTTGVYFIGIKGFMNGTPWYISLDDISVELSPACVPPSLGAASNVTANNASLDWSENGTATSWSIEYGLTGFTQGSGTTVAVAAKPHALSGLMPNTAYQFYYRSNCGGSGLSTWVGPVSFTTPCNASTIPFFEGFESGYTQAGAVAGCWQQASITGTEVWSANNTLTTYNRTPRTGGWNAYLRYGSERWLFIPVQLTGGTAYIASAYAQQDGTTTTNSDVGISYGTSATAAAMTNIIAAPTGINDVYQQIGGSFTPPSTGVYFIGIKGYMNFSPWYISLDDISIIEAPMGSSQSNAIVAAALPYSFPGDNLPANGFSNTYSGANNQTSPDRWFRVNPSVCQDSLTVSVCGASFDTYIHVLNSAGTEIASNDDNGPLCATTASSLGVKLPSTGPGTYYYVVVEGKAAATGTFTLAINSFDATAPTITTCPPNTTTAVNASCQGVLPSYIAGTAATDNCPGTPTITQSPAASTAISGNTVVTMTATDAAGKTKTCSFTVAVADNTPPTITCPATTQVVSAGATCTYALANFTGLTTPADNCSGVTASQFPIAGTIVGLGNTTLTMRATDGAGNTSSSCPITIQVVDNTGPTMTCQAPTTVSSGNACSVTATYTTPTGVDNCSSATVTRLSGLASGGSFPVGVNTVVYRGTDATGNSSTCSIQITVLDNQPPVIACASTLSKSTDLGSCTGTVIFSLATATDLCGAATVTQMSGPTSGSTFPIGNTVVVFKATDAANNTATCSRTIQVFDGEPTIVTCKPDVVRTTDPGVCQRSAAGISLLQPFAYDNCGISSISNNAPTGVNVYPIGATNVVWTVVDGSGNATTCLQKIIIKDADIPVITKCPQYLSVQPAAGDCSVGFVDLGVEAYDNCGSATISYTAPVYAVGSYDVEVTVTDNSGNTATCTVYVEVKGRDEICNGIDDDCDGQVDEADDWEEHNKIEAAGNSSDEFGSDVAIYETTSVIGARFDDSKATDAGAAYVYTRKKDAKGLYWERQAKLTPTDLQAEDFFGSAVSIYGDYIAVGAPGADAAGNRAGAIYVFNRNMGGTGNWGQVGKILASDAADNDRLGSAVAIVEDWVLGGAPLADVVNTDAGAAYLYARNMGGANAWGQVAKLASSTNDANGQFGTSVALSKDGYAMVGAPKEDEGVKLETGVVYMYDRNMGGANNWGMAKRIVSPSGATFDHFGQSVDMSSDRAIAGAPLADDKGHESGSAFVFEKNIGGTNNWGQAAKLFDYTGAADDQFGFDVAISDFMAIVGSRYDNIVGFASGSITTFIRQTDGLWFNGDKLNDKNGNQNNQFGYSLDLSGRAIIAGSPFASTARKTNIGASSIFEDDCDGTPIHNKAIGTPNDVVVNGASLKAAELVCYPSPVTDILNIAYEMPAGVTDATVQVINSNGQVVTTVHTGASKGLQTWTWDASAQNSGTYFVRLIAGDTVQVKSVTVIK